MVCVAYSGSAANMASRSSSISRRLALIGSSQAEHDAVALHGQHHALVRRPGALRGEQLSVHGAEALARRGLVEQPRIDHHLAVDAHAALLEEKAERIARVQIHEAEMHHAAPLEAKGDVELARGAAAEL